MRREPFSTLVDVELELLELQAKLILETEVNLLHGRIAVDPDLEDTILFHEYVHPYLGSHVVARTTG